MPTRLSLLERYGPKASDDPGSATESAEAPAKGVNQFLVALSQTDPLVWRRIQVPEHSSFWDLHVADPGRHGLA